MSSVVLTLTMNPSIDVSFSCDQVRAEIKMRCSQPLYEAGGGGINVSRALKKLGGETIAVFAAGGSGGELLDKLLSAEEINRHPFKIGGENRENITVSENSSDQQFRFVMPGIKMSSDECQAAIDAVSADDLEAEFLVASGSLPPGVPDDFYADLAKRMKPAGLKVVIDTKGEPLRRVAEEGGFMVKCNLREFKDLCGANLADEKEILTAAQKLIKDTGSENLVITLGAGGCFLVTRDKSRHFRSPTVPIKSKVGAGDSMTAGIVFKLSTGSDLNDAVAYGVASGAAAVMTPGTELCRKEDTERIYELIKAQDGLLS